MKDRNGQFQNKNKIDVIELKESEDDNFQAITLEEEEEDEKESNSSNLSSKNKNKFINHGLSEIKREINSTNNSEKKIVKINKNNKILNFDDSMKHLTDNFRKLFNKEDKNNNQIDIWNNENFRESFMMNNNMQLIFKFTDVIREIYENQLSTKMVEKNCDINRIIEIYIEKIKKLSQKRRIVVKDYQNKIYIIGAEMHINKIETQATEFIVKKKTLIFKGNNQIITNDDECYVIEINNNQKKKQIFYNLGDISSSLEFLFQKFEKYTVFK